ncbi:hypothetical protein [Desulfosporosinus sp. SB140]|uniref:hypothetical protein n=1 Tax=Desulfosporosinus paludis TaxID=3115649 RepID=UPI00388E4AF1
MIFKKAIESELIKNDPTQYVTIPTIIKTIKQLEQEEEKDYLGHPEIMERLGHKDDETTRVVCMHTTKAMKKEASQKFSELVKNL